MKPPTTPRRLPFIIAATATLMVAAIAGAVALDHADSGAPTGVTTSTPTAASTPTPSATPTPAIIAYADCSTATFGPALSALNPPSDIHVYSAEPAMTIDQSKLYEATIVTAEGDIVLCLQPDLAPQTVNNFVTLARNGFYNNIPFARVVSGFVIQTGDPVSYTHLARLRVSSRGGESALALATELGATVVGSEELKEACLLYTSRCV